jgi:hypothetical protein
MSMALYMDSTRKRLGTEFRVEYGRSKTKISILLRRQDWEFRMQVSSYAEG